MIETPEEFAQKVKDYCFDAWTMNHEQKQYMGEFLLDEATTLIAARDAAIRQECAKRAVKWLNNVKAGIYDDSLLTTIIGKEGKE
jgi:hypothetical protein